MTFASVSLVAGAVRLFVFSAVDNAFYGALAFVGLAIFALAGMFYERNRKGTEERWYLAILPPTLFICLYLFFGRTPIWFPYLLDSYGIVFAVLIILYLSTMFRWDITLVFVALLTTVDIILVLFTGSMVSAARSVAELRLPVLVSLPTLPTILLDGNRLYMSLGLGDFFFAGLLTIQTFKRYGKKMAILAAFAMTLSFFLFEVYILNFEVTAFPGTLMIICGWLVVAVVAESYKRMSRPRNQLP
jgi:hypothetical protein